ncbi:MAG: hypothetical protein O8C61_07015 [Candidatus Methanoperedens sp.]|nr:hypothetical protein [Candidatus Methanoperedens sp.]
MLESSEERVDLLKKGMDGKNLEYLYIKFNNFKIFPKQNISRKVNCWEFMNCGREIGGEKVDTLGLCPTLLEMSADGLNRGTAGGRICWAVSGTFCRKNVEGYFARKIVSCESCYFFQIVREEEEKIEQFILVKPGKK